MNKFLSNVFNCLGGVWGAFAFVLLLYIDFKYLPLKFDSIKNIIIWIIVNVVLLLVLLLPGLVPTFISNIFKKQALNKNLACPSCWTPNALVCKHLHTHEMNPGKISGRKNWTVQDVCTKCHYSSQPYILSGEGHTTSYSVGESKEYYTEHEASLADAWNKHHGVNFWQV